jgi:hypothetical protein
VGHSFFSIDVTLHDTILVDTNCSENVQGILVARVDTIENQANNNLLPGRTTLVPEF